MKKQRRPRRKASYAFFAPYPGYRIQMDTKAMAEHTGQDKRRSKTYQFTAIDIVSKIQYPKVMTGLSNTNSIAFVKEVIAFFEDIGITLECIQTRPTTMPPSRTYTLAATRRLTTKYGEFIRSHSTSSTKTLSTSSPVPVHPSITASLNAAIAPMKRSSTKQTTSWISTNQPLRA